MGSFGIVLIYGSWSLIFSAAKAIDTGESVAVKKVLFFSREE